MTTIRVVGICGSQRAASLNRAALRVAGSLLPREVRFSELTYEEVPFFHGDLLSEGFPASVRELREAVRQADGVLMATPEFNFSIPGPLKNALDWISRGDDQPFNRKPVALVSASPGPLGGARVQYELRKVLLCMNALALAKPEVFIGNAGTKFNADGACIDAMTQQFLAAQMLEFCAWIQATRRMEESRCPVEQQGTSRGHLKTENHEHGEQI